MSIEISYYLTQYMYPSVPCQLLVLETVALEEEGLKKHQAPPYHFLP